MLKHLVWAVALGACSLLPLAHAQTSAASYPSKPIKIIVPFPAGPAGTPKPVVDKLHAEVQRIVAMPEIKERLTTLGAEALTMSPNQFGQWLKQEMTTMTTMTTMAKVVKDGQVTVD